MFDFFYFAKNIKTREVCCFATKFLLREGEAYLAFWQINIAAKAIPGTRKKVAWGEETGHMGQLQAALGEDWEVYSLSYTKEKLAR